MSIICLLWGLISHLLEKKLNFIHSLNFKVEGLDTSIHFFNCCFFHKYIYTKISHCKKSNIFFLFWAEVDFSELLHHKIHCDKCNNCDI